MAQHKLLSIFHILQIDYTINLGGKTARFEWRGDFDSLWRLLGIMTRYKVIKGIRYMSGQRYVYVYPFRRVEHGDNMLSMSTGGGWCGWSISKEGEV